MIVWTLDIDGTEIEEPQGWNDLVLNIVRDLEWHGVYFEASTTSLQFYGVAAELLRTKKRTYGLAAEATLNATATCGKEVNILTASLDFGTYEEVCGNVCTVKIAIEKSGCLMTMRNRYDQKVDLSKPTAFDNTTLLPDYTGLNFDMALPPQKISIGNEAQMQTTNMTEVISDNPLWVQDAFGNFAGYIAPPLPDITNSSLGVFNASAIIYLSANQAGANNQPPYPDFPTATGTATLLGSIVCDLQDTVASFRLKGSAGFDTSGGAITLRTKLFRLPAGLDGTNPVNWISEYSANLIVLTTDGNFAFDTGNISVPLTLVQGDFIYFGIYVDAGRLFEIDGFSLTFHPETFFKLLTAELCPPTTANVGLVNEIGSRIVEAITDGCLTMKSDYYGRTDSEPYASDYEGCGGLRVLTNGLKIRNADPNAHFISLQGYFNGLKGIDNIGMGIEPNLQRPYAEWLRIEPVEYFYQDVRLMTMDFIPVANTKQEPTQGASVIKIGYQKWEVERVNGLDEFNSNKEFRTSLKTINNTFDLLSPFVAGGYPIETTRQQSFALTGQADTKYDNDTFIICTTREMKYTVTFDPTQGLYGTVCFYFVGDPYTTFNTGLPGGTFTVDIQGSQFNDGTMTFSGYNYVDGVLCLNVYSSSAPITAEVTDGVTFPSANYAADQMQVEQGNISSPANMFSPSTAYNWRIRPMYNLMRWWKSLVGVYINLSNTISQLFFVSGTGNYLAEGMLSSSTCRLENKVLAENDNLSKNDFAGTSVPLLMPETTSFNYPMSLADYLTIQANPYGYLEIQCGNGTFEKCFIRSIEYRPAQGTAVFNLIPKWQQ